MLGSLRRAKDAGKSPIGARSFCLACAALLGSVAGPAAAAAPAGAEVLTEADVIRRARAADVNAKVAREAAGLSEARAIRRGLYPNPTFGWQTQYVPGDPLENNFWLAMPVLLSGRRAAWVAALRASSEQLRAEAARARSAGVVRALKLFYRAIAAQRRKEIFVRTVARLDEAARVVRSRQAAGTAAGYEAHRVALAAELARSKLRGVSARAKAVRARLALLLGLGGKPLALRGSLATRSTERAAAGDDGGRGRERPSLRRARAALEASHEARHHAASSWIPMFTVNGGPRTVTQSGETRLGLAAGVTVSLPVFSRGQGVTAQAAAVERLASARLDAAERSVRLAVRAAQSELRSARAERTRFERATGDRVDRLVRAAESGYRAGRRSIVDLLDAERARAAVSHRHLTLALRAKLAELALRAASGNFE